MKKYIFLSLFIISCATLSSSNRSASITTLDNESMLKIRYDKDLPRQIVIVNFKGLPSMISDEKQGAIPIISKILEEGPASMTEETYRRALFLYNASISFRASYRSFQMTIVAPKATLPQAVDLAFETLSQPKFTTSQINQSIREVRANLDSSFSSMRNVILYYAFKDYFSFHPITLNGSTSPTRILSVKPKEIEEIYKKYFHLNKANFYSTGPLASKDLGTILNKQIEKHKIKPYQDVELVLDNIKKPSETKIKIIHRPKVTDHQVLFVFPFNVQLDSMKGIQSQVLFDLLGGGLTGELGRTLREERGLTYHASASYGRFLPLWYIYSFAGNEQIKDLLSGALEVKDKFIHSKINPDSFQRSVSGLLTSYKENSELPMDILSSEIYFDLFGMDFTYYRNFPNLLSRVRINDIQNLKPEVLKSEAFQLYLMGDKNILLAALRALGWDYPVEIIEDKNI